MRLNAVTLYIILLCSILLLSLTSVSSKSQTPCLQGTYTLDAAASDDVDKAIEGAIKGINIFIKSTARSRLRKTNVLYKQIAISYTEAEVSIATDQRPPLRTPANGTPVDWTREDGEKLKVSTVWESGKLKRTFKAEEGQRINTYSISVDGKTLTMQVNVTSPRLPRPLTYKLIYQRSN
jgi:hypothetical protein